MTSADAGSITAICTLPGQEEQAIVDVPITAKVSEAVAELKSKVMVIFKSYMASADIADEEVDLMEEVIEEDEPKEKRKRKKSKD